MNRFITITLSLLLLALLAFYWYEVRPTQKRIACAKIAKDIRFANGKQFNVKQDVKIGLTLDEAMKNEYAFCLHSEGL